VRVSSSNPTRPEPPSRVFLNEMRALLDAQRAEIEKRRRSHEISVERVAETQEQAAILSRNELSAAEINRDRRQLRDINEALHRMTTGAWGFCGRCSHAIPERRLEAMPTAEYCVRCAEVLEAAERLETEAVAYGDYD
jgi:DnaK suppressor protein